MNNIIYKLYNKYADEKIEAEPLTEQEVNDIMKRFKNDVRTSDKKRKKIRPGMVFVIAAAAVACIGTTAFAADRHGTFDKLKNLKDRTYITDDGRELKLNKSVQGDYSKVNEAAVVPKEPVSAQPDEESMLNINVEDIYCDGQIIMLGVTGSLKDGNSTGIDFIDLNDATVYINGEKKETIIANKYMVIDEGTENSFTGSIGIPLNECDWFTEKSELTVKFNNMYIGGATLKLNVTPDSSLIRRINKTVEEDGFSLTVYTISNAVTLTEEKWPEEFNERLNTCRFYYDGNGNEMTSDCFGAMQMNDGSDLMMWNTPENTDSITVKFFDKSTGEVFKLLTIDLTE